MRGAPARHADFLHEVGRVASSRAKTSATVSRPEGITIAKLRLTMPPTMRGDSVPALLCRGGCMTVLAAPLERVWWFLRYGAFRALGVPMGRVEGPAGGRALPTVYHRRGARVARQRCPILRAGVASLPAMRLTGKLPIGTDKAPNAPSE